MNEMEHVFPLPEIETHKLDEVREEIEEQKVLHRLGHFVRDNVRSAVLIFAVAGFFFGWTRSRRR